MRTRVGSLVCVAFATVAFASAGSATAESLDDSSSMTTAKIKAAGISLRHPETWTVMPRTRKELAAQERRLATKDPELAQLLVDHAQLENQLDTVKFRSIDLVGALSTGASAGNVRVYVHARGGFPSTLDEFVAGYDLLVRIGARILKTATLSVGGKTAYRVDVVFTPPRASGGTVLPDLRVSRLSFAQGKGDVRVDVTTRSDAGPGVADAILGSVRRI